MAPQPPNYGDVQYWDKKYLDNQNVFDWLISPDSFDHEISRAIQQCQNTSPRLLHIGSGTSSLSFSLLKHVNNASQICNVDYSLTAIEWGKSKDKELGDLENKGGMGWVQASLLHLPDVMAIGKVASFDLIVDKSTADSISCADDVILTDSFPFIASLCEAKLSGVEGIDRTGPYPCSIHPLQVLSVYLALLAAPGAVWLAVSYKASRFDFLDNGFGDDYEDETRCLPHPGHFWTIEKTTIFEADEERQGSGKSHSVHRPKTMYHLFQLKRTSAKFTRRSPFAAFG